MNGDGAPPHSIQLMVVEPRSKRKNPTFRGWVLFDAPLAPNFAGPNAVDTGRHVQFRKRCIADESALKANRRRAKPATGERRSITGGEDVAVDKRPEVYPAAQILRMKQVLHHPAVFKDGAVPVTP